MKRIFFMAFTGFICLWTSCNSGTTATADSSDSANTSQQKNLAAADVVMKAFQTGDVSGLDSVIADDYIDHTEKGEVKGRDSLKAMVTFVHTNFKDMKFEKVRDVADGDYVYNWINYTGNSDGTRGMPKGPYKMGTMEISKYKDGKVVEHWAFIDAQDMMKMMPPPPPPASNKTDTTKMKK